jgi:hypothetical protein
MTASDEEFEDFLKRRKPTFRAPDDMFEPPEELDRVVLRQAREAIETPRPLRVFSAPRWAAPVALAATLLLAVTVIFQAGMPQTQSPVPEVTVQNVAQRLDNPQPEAAMAPAPAANKVARESARATGPVVVELAAPAEMDRYATPPPSAPVMADNTMEKASPARAMAGAAMESAATAVVPAWRRDSKSWLAEIERLRSAGDVARAEAELAEYRRQQRAYAGAPDR